MVQNSFEFPRKHFPPTWLKFICHKNPDIADWVWKLFQKYNPILLQNFDLSLIQSSFNHWEGEEGSVGTIVQSQIYLMSELSRSISLHCHHCRNIFNSTSLMGQNQTRWVEIFPSKLDRSLHRQSTSDEHYRSRRHRYSSSRSTPNIHRGVHRC